jgi:ribosomal-protein-alanine N-acetyltransferase
MQGHEQIEPHIRYMIRRDMTEVLGIEDDVFEFPWTGGDFARTLRDSPCIGQVSEHAGRVVGFMVFCLLKDRIHLLNFAVARDYWRCGVGTLMIEKLFGKLSTQRRKSIVCEVRERNLSGQLFFCAMGFESVAMLRRYYKDADEDAYVFVRTIRGRVNAKSEVVRVGDCEEKTL